jgi:hypothetical protein
MKRLLLTLAGALAACGGSMGNSNLTAADMAANAPTYNKIALSQTDADMAPPAASGNSSAIQQDAAAAAPSCQPHLFDRSHELIGRLNRHFFKHLRHVEELIKDNPKLLGAGTGTWESVKDGIDRKLTITATTNSDGSVTYDFELDIKTTGDFVKVMYGSLTHKGPAKTETSTTAAVAVENSGAINFDFTALHSVIPTERATGQVSDTFDNVRDPAKGEKRVATVKLTAFLPEEGDPHGPRTGEYLWEREPGVGGSFEFEDTIALCVTSTATAQSDLVAVARWYKASDGGIHGRSDAKATGGQIPAGDTWMGAVCAQGQTSSAPAEGYWIIKLEDKNGVTLSGESAAVGSSPCDPLLGGLPPTLADNTHDFNFSSVDFSKPYPFPNQW